LKQFSQIELYHQKTLQLKKNLIATGERSHRLRKRVEKLQVKRQSEEIALAEKRERDMERERQLQAKVNISSNTKT
jgi:hypothetical protein